MSRNCMYVIYPKTPRSAFIRACDRHIISNVAALGREPKAP